MFDIDIDGKLFASYSTPDGEIRYECAMDCCPNLTCKCGDVTLSMFPAGARDTVPAAKIGVDVEKRIVKEAVNGVSPLEAGLALLTANNITDSDYDILYREYWSIKNYFTESDNELDGDFDFDYDGIEGRGALTRYNSILPFCDQFSAVISQRKCLIFDQYCVRGACDCSSANLEFALLDEKRNVFKGEFGVFADYRSRVWSLEDGTAESAQPPIPLSELKAMVEKQIPDIYDKLRKRHLRLKDIYSKCLMDKATALPFHADAAQKNKVGRNDPCPCGSGKKYKKCCLAK